MLEKCQIRQKYYYFTLFFSSSMYTIKFITLVLGSIWFSMHPEDLQDFNVL